MNAVLPAGPGTPPPAHAPWRAWVSHHGPHLLPLALAVLGLAAIPFDTWASLTIAGLAMGVIIFMMAAGLGLVFGLMDILNYAHGAFITFGCC